jgi:type II pantothenate kinase
MYLSIDFGGSTIDAIIWQKKGKFFLPVEIKSFERAKVFLRDDLSLFFKKTKLPFTSAEKIYITGGRSRFFPAHFQNIPLVKVSEIEAIGRGGFYLLHKEKKLRSLCNAKKILVVSMGTGTCMVELQQRNGKYVRSIHRGGTGVGGGTFLGLSRALLHQTDPQKILQLFRRGDQKKVDLSVGELIGSGIGKVPAEATASNLARLYREVHFSKADLSAGIVNLIGQTIGMVATFAAKAYKAEAVLLTGKLTRVEPMMDIILQTAKIYKIPTFVPKEGAFVSAFGSGNGVSN